MNKLITIPLRDFALPAPRYGSIEAHSGDSRSAVEAALTFTTVTVMLGDGKDLISH